MGMVAEQRRAAARALERARDARAAFEQHVSSVAPPVVSASPSLGSALVLMAVPVIPAQLILVKPTSVNSPLLFKPVVCDEDSIQGNFFLRSDFAASTSAHGHAPKGVMESPVFEVGSGANMSFLVAGGHHPWPASMPNDVSGISCDPNSDHAGITAVTLEKSEGSNWRKILSATGNNSASFRSVHWDLSGLSGEKLRVRVYDLAVGDWGYAALDQVDISGCRALGPNPFGRPRLENPAGACLLGDEHQFAVKGNQMALVFDLARTHWIDGFRVVNGNSSTSQSARADLHAGSTVRGPWRPVLTDMVMTCLLYTSPSPRDS
eukprot:TRINITY_DN51011_c0_g1_i1.p1 TRINITY_DN51011_c0_g1~~TRINITY_DN51011_c0_g1_i1.p1  ORF type:complete len:321 (+),score=56.82 TRINITY_DN51011_c0_g1_i1:2-964(+)